MLKLKSTHKVYTQIGVKIVKGHPQKKQSEVDQKLI